MAEAYRDYADFLAEHFDGKVQKISINAGFRSEEHTSELQSL